MPSLDMGKLLRLTRVIIDQNVSPEKRGNYALGYVEDKNFCVLYVGRSDSDVKSRLLQHVDEDERFTHFKFSYARTKLEAFEKECKNFHDFGGSYKLLNEIHPDSPNGMDATCPICGE